MEIKRSFDAESLSSTKAKVIAAATRLFATKGMENVFLRELTSAAGVNLAAVNYHFGSKEALCEAVLDSLSERVNARRLAGLRQLLAAAEAKGMPPSLPAILDTFVEPYLGPDEEGEGAVLLQLLIKDRISRNEMTARIVRKHFDPLALEYIAAFAKACPQVHPDDLYWRYTLMYGAVIMTASDRSKSNRIATMSMGRLDASDPVALRQAVLDFLVPAISAPSRKPTAPSRKSAAPGRKPAARS